MCVCYEIRLTFDVESYLVQVYFLEFLLVAYKGHWVKFEFCCLKLIAARKVCAPHYRHHPWVQCLSESDASLTILFHSVLSCAEWLSSCRIALHWSSISPTDFLCGRTTLLFPSIIPKKQWFDLSTVIHSACPNSVCVRCSFLCTASCNSLAALLCIEFFDRYPLRPSYSQNLSAKFPFECHPSFRSFVSTHVSYA